MVDNNKKTTGGCTGKGFKPGQSGNPGGRPKRVKPFKDRCQTFMEEEGIDALISIAQSPRDKNRFKALELIAAYSWGKPKQGVELTGEDGGDINITIERI